MADAPKQLRLTDETFEQFKKIASDNGLTAQQTMESLLLSYETGITRAENPDILTDIDTFQLHMNAIQESYLHIVQLKKDTEERVRVEFIQKLETKDTTIADLQGQKTNLNAAIENITAELEQHKAVVENLTEEKAHISEALQAAQSQLQDKDDIIAGLKDKTLVIESLREQNKQYISAITAHKEAINTATTEIAKLKDELSSQNTKIKDLENKAEIDKQKAELEKQLAVSQIKENYSDKIEALRSEKERLLEEISHLKDSIRALKEPKPTTRKKKETE